MRGNGLGERVWHRTTGRRPGPEACPTREVLIGPHCGKTYITCIHPAVRSVKNMNLRFCARNGLRLAGVFGRYPMVAGATAAYVWEDPGDSIMVQITLDVVERLGDAVQQSLGTGPRGAEIGGILIGRSLPGGARTVQIED